MNNKSKSLLHFKSSINLSPIYYQSIVDRVLIYCLLSAYLSVDYYRSIINLLSISVIYLPIYGPLSIGYLRSSHLSISESSCSCILCILELCLILKMLTRVSFQTRV